MKVYLKETKVSKDRDVWWLQENMRETDLLHLFGPLWRVAERHEYTVGQNRTHDDHAEQCEKAEVKEKEWNSA